MLYQAADSMLKGEDVTMQASMLKLKTGRIAREITGMYRNLRNNELFHYRSDYQLFFLIADSCLQFWGMMYLYLHSN